MKITSNTIGVIVIGDHVQALGIIRNLGRHNIPVYLMNDKSFCIGRFSKYLKKFVKCPDINDTSMLVEFLVKFAKKENLNGWILMPTNDLIVITLSRKKKILERYYKVPVANWDIIKKIYNPKILHSLAKKNKISVPKTYYPKDEEEVEVICKKLKFPVLIKPSRPLEIKKKKIKTIIHSKNEILKEYQRISHILKPSEIMIQELIHGPHNSVYAFDSFFKEKRAYGIFTSRNIRRIPMKIGTCCFEYSFYEPEIIKLGIRLLKALDYYGIADIEFKKDTEDKKFKLIEINPRTWAENTLPTRCGVNLVEMLYKDTIGEEVEPSDTFKEGVKWLHIYADLLTNCQEIKKGKFKLRAYLNSMKGKKEFGVFSIDDLLPFIAETIMIPYLWMTRLPGKGVGPR